MGCGGRSQWGVMGGLSGVWWEVSVGCGGRSQWGVVGGLSATEGNFHNNPHTVCLCLRYYSGHMIVQWSAHPPGQWSEFNTHSGQVYLG